MSTKPKTQPSVFIIESLSLQDERHDRFEGRILNHILMLARKDVRYAYIRTTKELRAMLKEFDQSRMRYLHISCHGNPAAVGLTLDDLPFTEFGALIRPFLDGRRLFLSACEVVNDRLAEAVMSGSGCNSVIGPKRAITFRDAAIMWASFYHLIFRHNPVAMKQEAIKGALAKICDTFGEPFLYYRASRSATTGFKKYTYR